MSARLLEQLKRAKAVVFDFDGTLVDSNAIKIGAFEKCFAPEFPDRLKEIMAYCRRHHHTPRQIKFRTVYEEVLKLPYTKAVEKKMLARYESETTRQVIAACEIPGSTDFLRGPARGKKMALLSSTPHPILRQILKARRLDSFFEEVQGAPVDKARWLNGFEKKHRLAKGEILFFGDTDEDAQAARQAGVPFVGVSKKKIAGAVLQISDFTKGF